jgi:uncharacterized membrane protein YhaH (DUF805 family)
VDCTGVRNRVVAVQQLKEDSAMTFTDSIQTCFRKFVTFSGRAGRAEYWWFVLFVFLVSAALSVVDAMIWGPYVSEVTRATRDASGAIQTTISTRQEYGNGPFASLWGLVSLLPLLAAGWRRLHDTGRPGWVLFLPWIIMLAVVLGMFAAMGASSGAWSTAETGLIQAENFGVGKIFLSVLAIFIPFIALFVFLCQKSQPGTNRFGPNPYEVPA